MNPIRYDKEAKCKFELNQNEEKFVKELKKDPSNITAAAKIAFPRHNDPAQKGYQVLQKPKVYEAFAKYCRAWSKAIPDEVLIQKHKELLSANKITIINGEAVESPDNAARIHALRIAYELKKFIKSPENIDQTIVNQVTAIQISYDTPGQNPLRAA
jgi:hypothetical protein